jgi:hypothetical protein
MSRCFGEMISHVCLLAVLKVAVVRVHCSREHAKPAVFVKTYDYVHEIVKYGLLCIAKWHDETKESIQL